MGRERRRVRKRAVICTVLLALALSGCGQGAAGGKDVYSMEVPEGYELVRDVRYGYFLAPGTEGSTSVTSFDGPLSADERYVLSTEDGWTSVCLNDGLIACRRMEGRMDAAEAIREFERTAGVRLSLTGLEAAYTDPDTEISKALYRADAQALLDDEYYGIFSGMAALIVYEDMDYMIFSGTPTGSGADPVPVTSFFIKPYDLSRNASSVEDMEDLSGYEGTVEKGEYGRAWVWYKGTTVHKRNILVRCTGAGILDRKMEHLTLKGLGSGLIPDPPEGLIWAWADIEEDYGTTDTGTVRPALPLYVETAEGELAGRPYTVLKDDALTRVLFTVPEGTEEIRILAGLSGLVINVSLS